MPELILTGCAPVPLAHYLKALGVLRLVAESEHGDPAATARWSGDYFALHSRFDRDSLAEFFLEKYEPTAVLAPWNGGSGFYFQEEKLNELDPATGKKRKTGKRNQPTEATRVVEAIAASSDTRFSLYRSAIRVTRTALARHGYDSAPDGREKDDLLLELRACWPDDAVRWLDCVLVLVTDDFRARSPTGLVPSYTTLLGSGANDGNADFSSNFMQRLKTVLLEGENTESGRSREWLLASLFGGPRSGAVITALAGQYSPGNAGGPNMTSGFKGESSVNPWDFILLIEGSLAFAAAAVKRHGEPSPSSLAYPFAVRTSGAGYASGSPKDEVADKSQTEELWLPLWEQRTSNAELLAVLSEGRGHVGKAAATSGVDFARAVCSNGTERGFSEFVRFGFLIRRGDSSSATPLGRFRVKRNARIDILKDADDWMERLRRQASPLAKQVPSSVARALHTIEHTIFDFCRHGSPDALQKVLIALGAAERALAGSFAWTVKNHLQPLSRLRPEWLDAATTDRTEFRLAQALASTRVWIKKSNGSHWLRQHLEPVSIYARWLDQPDGDTVWHDGSLSSCLNDIVERRHLWLDRHGADSWLDHSPRPARLEDITAFIEHRTDDRLLADLLWGMSLVDWQAVSAADKSRRAEETGGPCHDDWRSDDFHKAVPSAFYALMKLCHRPESDTFPAIPLTPAIHRLAAAGRGQEASRLAARRLLASGCAPLVRELPIQADTARRTAAALLFPLSQRDLRLLEKYTLSEPQS